MFLGFRKYCLVLLLWLAPLPQSAAMSPMPTSGVPDGYVEPFMAFFDALALTEDYGPYNSRPPWIRKWTGPVAIVLEGRAEALRPQVLSLIGRISGWTGLPFSIVKQNDRVFVKQTNLVTIRLVSPEAATHSFTADDIVCQTETHGLGGSLHTGTVKVREDFTDCLPHEFMHVLGFDAHWDPDRSSPIRSVLAYRDSAWRTADFSPWDILAITLLYDWRLRAGMPRGAGLKVARNLVHHGPQSAALPLVVRTARPHQGEPGSQVQSDRPRGGN